MITYITILILFRYINVRIKVKSILPPNVNEQNSLELKHKMYKELNKFI